MNRPTVTPRGVSRPQVDFRLARVEDLPAILSLIDDAKAALKAQGVDQWQNGYPNEEIIANDIDRNWGRLFLRDEIAIGYLALIPGPEPTYGKISGAWLTQGIHYTVIHRFAVATAFKGAGVAAAMVGHVKNSSRRDGRASVRIDTHRDNAPMRRFLEKNSFEFCGEIYLEDGAARNAYEILLNP